MDAGGGGGGGGCGVCIVSEACTMDAMLKRLSSLILELIGGLLVLMGVVVVTALVLSLSGPPSPLLIFLIESDLSLLPSPRTTTLLLLLMKIEGTLSILLSLIGEALPGLPLISASSIEVDKARSSS